MVLFSKPQYYAPFFRVDIEKERLGSSAVLSVTIDEYLNKPSSFSISLNEGLDIKSQKFIWLDKPLLNPGNKVEITFGYGSGKNEKHMKGTIKALDLSFKSEGATSLTVRGFDLSHVMQKKWTKVNDQNVKYSDIAREIAAKYKLKTEIEDPGKKHKKVERKPNENDYPLLQRLAEKIGFEFFVRMDTLYFRKPKEDKKSVKTFQYRQNFISFDPDLSIAKLIPEVVATAYNPATKKRIKVSIKLEDICSSQIASYLKKLVKDAEGTEPKILEDRPFKSEEEARNKAKYELKKALDGFIQGTLVCIGDPDLPPGDCIEINGLGKLFSGKYYIKSATHTFDNAGYKTNLKVRRVVV